MEFQLQILVSYVESAYPQLLFLMDAGRRMNLNVEQALLLLWKTLNQTLVRGFVKNLA